MSPATDTCPFRFYFVLCVLLKKQSTRIVFLFVHPNAADVVDEKTKTRSSGDNMQNYCQHYPVRFATMHQLLALMTSTIYISTRSTTTIGQELYKKKSNRKMLNKIYALKKWCRTHDHDDDTMHGC